ncbi:uncharacterized protein LOC108255439 isoform X2 [Ictalurus punctatus]|uniref:Uncharacterized protein LOC108255439 isoform X2 n=1 Tax=Ictalurus punctatus TaxID=7998 RepID=A0A2D0PN76_ICTPU|nr:uncharacterized protein LOC108255439 isoform X2 [Ictalurus punctatus]
MVHFTTLPLFLCTVGFISETLCSLTLEAEAGDNVTIWCQHDLKHPDKIFWFKHTSGSVPLLLGCKQFFTSAPSENCYFFTESERIVMSVHGKNTSLTITAVNVSDTGLYYCSFRQLDQMNFSNSTSLQVKGIFPVLQGPDCSSEFFILNAVFGAVIVILLGVLIFIILKHRKTHRDENTDRLDNEEQEPDSMNYAGLQITNKKTKSTGRDGEIVDQHVLYSTIRQ